MKKSLEFVKQRIKSGICNGMENNEYKHMYEVDFRTIAGKIKFNEAVKVSENLWETQLCFDEDKMSKISIRHNPDADFQYFSTAICCCDGTFIFFMDLCGEIFKNILTGQLCYIPQKPKDAEENPYRYDVFFEVGNFVFAEEYGEQFSTEEKKWMKSRFTVMLPVKCSFVEKDK